MYQLGNPRRAYAVPGPEPMIEGPCSACGSLAGLFVRKVVDQRDATVCLDADPCRDRVIIKVMEGEL